jgi:hypothetical protein
MTDLKKLAEELYWSLNAEIPNHYHDGTPENAVKEDVADILEALERVQKKAIKTRIKWPSEEEIEIAVKRCFPAITSKNEDAFYTFRWGFEIGCEWLREKHRVQGE